MKQQQFQFNIHGEPSVTLPPGLMFVPEVLSEDEQARLLEYIRTLPFKQFAMRGVTARRRIIHYGLGYSFDSRDLASAPLIPRELEPLRARAASVVGLSAEKFAEALVTEYQPGAGIGWHRDAPPFGIVVGISLGGECRMRFRQRVDHDHVLSVPLPAGSLYALIGPSRNDWEHMIPPMKAERYSITFRTLKDGRRSNAPALEE